MSILICLLLPGLFLSAQTIQLLTSGTKTSLRGLSVVNDGVIWVSGSSGMVGKSIDSGKTFNWTQVKGFEKTDFRDIEAFDENVALIMAIAEPAYILRTIDGGLSWKVVFEDTAKGMFLDAMDFFDDKNGIVIGDPVKGRYFLARTSDGGKAWHTISTDYPIADSGEACFASSGTNIRMANRQDAIFITGGLKSSFIRAGTKTPLPLVSPGKETTGANSIALKNEHTFIVVGGDFNAKDSTGMNCLATKDAGRTWEQPVSPPHGYRSCVEYIGDKSWISCGLNGVDYSMDEGNHWEWVSKESYHVCRKAKKGKAVFFAGGGGRIGKLVLP